ncbi:hypothetical protein LSUE1_G006908 [Lachnellula suecica]|uniref:Uncharacterized protein n=1 Tax=Lachnellula suecica TaxID=602035 RepID=A0A8T9C632_9HELO|nr:hypothetical protein LSUE1_G006908 [Lachnellula suecica]
MAPSNSSRHDHANLTIRTSFQPAQAPPAPQSTTSSTPEQPYPKYPIPIPVEKQEKALKLYKIYLAARYEEELTQRQLDPSSAISNHHGYYLSVPGTPAPRSATSRTSSKQRRRAASVSTSAWGGATEMSSVMSFDGNESPSSAKKAELSTFDGKKVKQRTRQKFPKAAKAKTALIRHLGSCWVCNKRRVPCDLEEHHDIQTLERLKQAGSKRHSHRSKHQSQSPIPQQNATPVSGEQPVAQMDALFGLGQNEELQTSTPFDMSHLDIQSPAYGEPLQDISAPATSYYPNSTSPPLTQIPMPTTKMATCSQLALAASTASSNAPSGPGYTAATSAPPTTHATRPPPPTSLSTSTSTPLPPPPPTQPPTTPTAYSPDPDMTGGNFNNTGNYNYQPDNTYGGPSQGYEYNPYSNNSTPNNTHFQGGFQRAWHVVEEKSSPYSPRWQTLLSFVTLLFLTISLFFSYTSIRCKEHLQTNLPVIGFLGIVASFAMCSSVKHFTVQRVRCVRKCPLRGVKMAPDGHGWGRAGVVYS